MSVYVYALGLVPTNPGKHSQYDGVVSFALDNDFDINIKDVFAKKSQESRLLRRLLYQVHSPFYSLNKSSFAIFRGQLRKAQGILKTNPELLSHCPEFQKHLIQKGPVRGFSFESPEETKKEKEVQQ